jgi:biopolymer transport protein ExbD
MPKVKIARKNISLDMTAMCDMAFLLLTFFILTTKFKPQEPVVVDTPSAASVSEKTVPSDSIMILSISKEGNVFLGIDNQNKRLELIDLVCSRQKITLSEEQKVRFSAIETFGIPMGQLEEYLSKEGPALMENHPGIPSDSSNNELVIWIALAKEVNPGLRIAIRGDRLADFKDAKKVISTLQDLNLNHISFVTNLEAKPQL